MNETIEKLALQIIGQISEQEKKRNKYLQAKAAKVMRAIEYFKAVVNLDKSLNPATGAY